METEAYMTLAEVKKRQASLKDKMPLDQAIAENIQNWAQWLLDEGFEGSYFTAKLNGNAIMISDLDGRQVATVTTDASSYVDAFKQSDRMTMLTVQSKLRRLIDQHGIKTQ
ncbi:hypothetical protein LACPH_000252 [Lacticaseibacillus parahuelsenbergensis]|uniref:Uncharacterized protein n=1 Tax=Lacticaseibacillus parahuelsenbergensis TaxID=3068305 RepID=A0ABY9L3X4_9LACO|nr:MULTISPECIES: hypothetical protein [Lacticaseibacillus]MDE3281381.1 hypothetical protein [Lacticaseibacillus casei]WLV78302.1 hypothetical protein LACPH_000252 [Lacticaseibacillus sp. NCIMB 15471]